MKAATKLKKVLMKRTLFLSMFLFITISACAEEPVNVSSDVDKAERSIVAVQALPESIPSLDAPQVLTLDECIDIAINNNLPLKTAKKNVKVAEWRLFETRRNLLPKVTVDIQEYGGKIYGRHFVGKKRSVELNQTFFHGGEFFYTMKQAETNLKVSSREYSRIKNELLLQVKKGYYTLVKAKKNMEYQDELSRNVSRIHDMVSKQFEAGIASNLEFLNVSSQAYQIKFQLTSARGDEEVASLILKQAMNIDARESIDIEPPPEFKKVDVEFEKILADALVYRPEMQISTLMVAYYNYGLKVAKSKSWPKIDGMASFGMAKEEFISKDASYDPVTGADSDQKMEQQWYAGVKCSLPVWGSTMEYTYTKEVWVPVVSSLRGTETITNDWKFNFLDNLAQFSEKATAEVDLERAKQELIKTKQDVELEVKEGCFSYEKALLQLDTAASKVKYQESDLEVTKFRREMDEVADSNVIDSMIKLAQEKFGYVQALSDCNVAVASISKAVGVPNYFNGVVEKNDKN